MKKRINIAIRANMFRNMILIAISGALGGEIIGMWLFPHDKGEIADCLRAGLLIALLLLVAVIELTGGRKKWTQN